MKSLLEACSIAPRTSNKLGHLTFLQFIDINCYELVHLCWYSKSLWTHNDLRCCESQVPHEASHSGH